MELKDLSCNWKKLQETLKNDTSKPPKRKASEDVLQPQRNGAKRLKTSLKPRKSHLSKASNSKNTLTMREDLSKQSPSTTSANLVLWAEDNNIPTQDLIAAYGTSTTPTSISFAQHVPDILNQGLSPVATAGKYVSIDCEMVGVGPMPAIESALARVSLVNYHGHQLYDSFVLPKETVTDYRTAVSGVTPQLLRSGRPLEVVQRDVAGLIEGKILVGHAIRHDLDALLLGHPKRDIRDTSRHADFRRIAGGKTPALKRLAKELLGVEIQGGEHSSIEDARATMLLFRREKEGFESEHTKRWGTGKKVVSDAPDGEVRSKKGRSTKRKKSKR
ncbi:3'-5' exonuclease [Toensbergia leucococca]|nr:3'-5' exonuclease [Toensbergia leucococca]